jgi:CDP-diacylglycerol--glycerol-3-phosphate 3-phosphatidyltransferase
VTEKPRRAETATSNWNVPNVLTVIRIVLVPVYVVLLFTAPEGVRWAATVVFVLAMLTDLADGHIARKHNLITDFGKLWDPIADKALTGAAFVSLSILTLSPGRPELSWVFTIIILVREWGITWVREILKKYGNVMAANKGGKAKTVTQTLALILFSLGLQFLPGWLGVVAWALMWAALILTVVTGIDYLIAAWRIRRDALAKRQAG